MTYSEQIKNPMWQKKRLEILNRDEFMCQCCGETDDELHVHHICYEFNRKIWDYDDNKLITLCGSCHSTVTDLKRIIKLRIDNNFIYTDTLNELEGIIAELEKYNPYELNLFLKKLKKNNVK